MVWLSEWWNQVSATVLYGLEITLVGMALVFFTLGLVILAMILLTKLPWLQPREQSTIEEEAMAASTTIAATAAPSPQKDELAQVAAIVVATLHGRRTARMRVQAKAARSAWKHYGRANQLGL